MTMTEKLMFISFCITFIGAIGVIVESIRGGLKMENDEEKWFF